VLDAMPRLVLESAFVVGMLALIAAGAATGSVAAMLPLVSLYAYAGFRVIPAAHRIALQANNLRWSLSASAGLAGDLARLERAATVRPSTDGQRLPFRTELTAVDVSFAYEGSPAPVLTHVDVAIRRGESVAIVGATGAGKTTLVDLLIGLLTPSGGRVTVDGTPIDAACAAWQRNIGYVPQNPFMLDDTLRRNIALGIRDEEIDERAVAAAMRLARLEGVAERLPNGLDTSIGEHGVRLSGGERQRVSIARALYHDPALLIFDEATSSLDPATERDIAEAIEPLRGGRTIVVIAHRLSTVERCDRVLLLDRGRIAAAGPYGELAAGNAAFRALAAL
jgi:ATP-binding cassette subfamily C protein